MPAVGGSILSITINNRTFQVAADADGSRKIGGWENEVQANGDGTARQVKTRVPWSLTGIQVEIDDIRGDHEFLQDIADGNEFYPVTITLASGLTWQGDGTVTDSIEMSTQNATAQISLMGSGALTKQ